MGAQALAGNTARLDVGDVWPCYLLITSDTSGLPVTGTVTAAVTDPDGAEVAVTVTTPARGIYLAAPTLDVAGRWTLVADVEGVGVVTFAATAAAVTSVPTLAQVLDYLGETSFADAEVADALAAEAAAQVSACRVPADYPADLAQALKRRVARNLAARSVPVATFTSFEGGQTSARVPALDVEVARFERPWRKLSTRIG